VLTAGVSHAKAGFLYSMNNISIQASNLTKRYGNLTAVDGLTLQVQHGDVFGLLGPNGAGKTTTINMLCGLLQPDSGEVLLNGKPAHGRESRLQVGVCPQNIVLWGTLTCIEQMEFIGEMYGIPRKIARRRSGTLLDAMGLAEKQNKLARTLSGGMQRRLNLAMALVHDPGILVLDEPEAGLDPQSRVLIREYVRSLARQKTVILTTHNMDEAERMADRVAIIDHGRLIMVDTPEALKRTVGEGDVLEVDVTGLPVEMVRQAVIDITPGVASIENTLIVRARGVVDNLPSILDALKRAGCTVGEVRLRANSLEDVFISLTGRKLRE
jgi:ABC-2 type transport system ATP-binding protein